MTKGEKGIIISTIVIMVGIFVGILCLMFSHYHETNKKPIVTISKKVDSNVYTINFYKNYAVYLLETDGVTGLIQNETKLVNYKNEINLNDLVSKLKSTSLPSGVISVKTKQEDFYVNEDNEIILELLKSIGKESFTKDIVHPLS